MFSCACCAPSTDEKAQVITLLDDEGAAPMAEPTFRSEPALPAAQSSSPPPEVAPEPKAESEAKPSVGQQPEASPVAAVSSFTAVIEKDSAEDDVGWHLDLLDKQVPWVSRIVPSESTPLQRYNAGVPFEKQVREGDYIKRVNKETNSAQGMRDIMRGEVQLEIEIHRPQIFRQTIVKDGASMGLDLLFGPASSSLVVEEVRDGAVKRCFPDVQRGDRITKVNGQQGDSAALMQAIKASDRLEIEFSRCAG
mmetsp:Transcript_122894/g.306951  ORF Transcript_122894/g.306951 Transcript_122894/m.306951 type:complete len:251 (+) Transcript_122894:91-843(+)